MSLQWDGKYKFEPGDVVEVVNDKNPFNGLKGVVKTCYSTKQFGVMFLIGEVSLWEDDLKSILTHHPMNIPKAFLES